MTKVKKNSEQYQENVRKQQFLNANGIKVKIDGTWGPWQEQQYKKLTTKKKEYPVSIGGAIQHLVDNLTGENTYQIAPSEIKADNRSTFGRYMDQQLQNPHTPLGYVYQNVIPAAGIATIPISVPMFLRTVIPAVITGAAANKAANTISESLTGKTTKDLVRNYTGNELSFLGEPGTYVGGKVGYNYKNLGRYVMDNIYPANYEGHGLDFATAFAKALNPFSKVPHFYNGRKPKWYNKYSSLDDTDFRLENMAQWVGVSEKEMPRVLTVDNGDGTRGFTRTIKRPILPDIPKEGDRVIEEDLVFGVGGEHSDFTYKGSRAQKLNNNDVARRSLWLYEDNQILNPQYKIANLIKDAFKIDKKKHPKLVKVIDYFGGKDLKGFIGFDNDIKYKQFLHNDELFRFNPKTGQYELIADKISTVPYDQVGKEYK